MANTACDLDLTTGLNDGTSWANAWQTFDAAAAGVAAGDICYVQGSTDTTAVSETISGTVDNPAIFIGVKDGTTNFPAQVADIVDDRNDASIPIVQTTAGGDVILQGFAYFWGIKFVVTDNALFNTLPNVSYGMIFEECYFKVTDVLGFGDERQPHSCYLKNCAYEIVDAGSLFTVACKFTWEGGETVGGAAHTLFTESAGGGSAPIDIIGVDLSSLTSGTIAATTVSNRISLQNCKPGVGFVPAVSTTLTGWTSPVSVELSKSGTGITNPIVDIKKLYRQGTVEHETTVVRSGGASDGTTPSSRKMTLNDSASYEGFVPLKSFRIFGWIDTTSASTATIYIHNTGADVQDDQVWAEIFVPVNDSAQYKRLTSLLNGNDKTGVRGKPLTAPTTITDDASTWNGGSAFSQKIEFDFTPDHKGPIYGYVYYAEDGTSLPSLYYDPAIYVT